MAFVTCRCTLTKMLAGATREKKGRKGGGGQVRLLTFDTERLTGLKYKLICYFKLAADMIRDGIREFVNGTDGPAAPANTLLSLNLQLMKAAAPYIFIFSPGYLRYCDDYRHESCRCRTLSFFLTCSIILPVQVFLLY